MSEDSAGSGRRLVCDACGAGVFTPTAQRCHECYALWPRRPNAPRRARVRPPIVATGPTKPSTAAVGGSISTAPSHPQEIASSAQTVTQTSSSARPADATTSELGTTSHLQSHGNVSGHPAGARLVSTSRPASNDPTGPAVPGSRDMNGAAGTTSQLDQQRTDTNSKPDETEPPISTRDPTQGSQDRNGSVGTTSQLDQQRTDANSKPDETKPPISAEDPIPGSQDMNGAAGTTSQLDQQRTDASSKPDETKPPISTRDPTPGSQVPRTPHPNTAQQVSNHSLSCILMCTVFLYRELVWDSDVKHTVETSACTNAAVATRDQLLKQLQS